MIHIKVLVENSEGSTVETSRVISDKALEKADDRLALILRKINEAANSTSQEFTEMWEE